MKIEYVCHSSLFVETEDTNLLFDPWWNGPAYFNRWYIFPRPVNISFSDTVKNILITHGHHDHLHADTLKLMPEKAHVFFPYQWRKGITGFLNTLGFEKVTEAISLKSYQLSSSAKITYISFALESVIVVENNGEILVNLNDALNSHHQSVVDAFLIEIARRWPVIDYLFSGWSGAGYFPNCVHFAGKDDMEVGKLREQYFTNHFCKIVQALQPKRAIPFAPGFALLDDDKRWINDVKFPREYLDTYYKKYFDSKTTIQFLVMQPGDYITNGVLIKKTTDSDPTDSASVNNQIYTVYEKEILQLRKIEKRQDAFTPELQNKLSKYINEHQYVYPVEVLKEAAFSIRLKDSIAEYYFNIHHTSHEFIIEKSEVMAKASRLLITTTSDLLNYSFDHEWGGDVLTIGYGMDIEVFDELALEKNLDIVCVRLISRFPKASKTMIRQPFRTARFFLTNTFLSKLYIKQKLMERRSVNKFPYNERDHWMSYTKCELCRVCNMPLLSFEFGEQLNPGSEKQLS